MPGRALWILFATLSPLLCSCVMVPIPPYPKLDYIPPSDVGSNSDDVKAYRVETRNNSILFFKLLNSHKTVSEIPISNNHTEAQFQGSWNAGFGWIGIVGDGWYWNHSLSVRLYRPGYDLVELTPWDLFSPIKWAPAKDLKAQEKAIEDLLSIQWQLNKIVIGPLKWLERLSDENEIRVFLFAASEYERIAKMTNDPEYSKELSMKADIIRGLVKK
jgi:hypothetical protein